MSEERTHADELEPSELKDEVAGPLPNREALSIATPTPELAGDEFVFPAERGIGDPAV